MKYILRPVASVVALVTATAAFAYASGTPSEQERYGTRWHMWKHKYGNWSGFIGSYQATAPDGTYIVASGLRCADCGFVNTHRVQALTPESQSWTVRSQPSAWVEMNAAQKKQLDDERVREKLFTGTE